VLKHSDKLSADIIKKIDGISGNILNELQPLLDEKADKTELTTKADKTELAEKADKTELAEKADLQHTHSLDDIIGIQNLIDFSTLQIIDNAFLNSRTLHDINADVFPDDVINKNYVNTYFYNNVFYHVPKEQKSFKSFLHTESGYYVLPVVKTKKNSQYIETIPFYCSFFNLLIQSRIYLLNLPYLAIIVKESLTVTARVYLLTASTSDNEILLPYKTNALTGSLSLLSSVEFNVLGLTDTSFTATPSMGIGSSNNYQVSLANNGILAVKKNDDPIVIY
jgi:hypothetical protein